MSHDTHAPLAIHPVEVDDPHTLVQRRQVQRGARWLVLISLLLLGLGSRLASVPLIFTMLVAYATADQAALQAVFTDTDKFTGATPFLFLFACLIIFTFGPGKVSLDTLLTRKSVK